MRDRSVQIQAESEAEAIAEAARQLDADPETVELESLGAEGYVARLRDADAEIEVEISPDGMRATVTGFSPANGDGTPLCEEAVRQQLREAGVEIEPDPEGLRELLERVQSGVSPQGIVIARGQEAEDGEDGSFEPVVDTESSVGTVKDDGRIDFYERNTVVSVAGGSLLARAVPPTPGTPGRDVRGKVLPARDGRPAGVRPGRNVQVSEDGREWHAAEDGIVRLEGNVLSVTDTFEIQGDVDLTTGNIRAEYGSLVVRGNIRSGFTVSCGGDLTVQKGVEDAVVEAGGDISIRLGIAMQKEGSVDAGGDLSARFAENATIRAAGDVVIDNDISNCHIVCGGRIVATRGKGRIQGGTVQAAEGVEANQIGSSLGVSTELAVGRHPEGYDELLAEKEELQQMLQRIATTVGSGEDEEVLERTPQRKRDTVRELLQARSRTAERLREINRAISRQRQQLRRSCQARVEAYGPVFPGTLITIAGMPLQIQEKVERTAFYYDAEEGIISSTSL